MVNTFGPIPINRLFSLEYQMLQALEKLRDLNIVHGDLKPGNILMVNMDNSNSWIWVLPYNYETNSLYGYLQTSYYRAPEMIVGLPIAKSIVMWGVGYTIGEIAVGRPMFPGSNDYETLVRITITRGVTRMRSLIMEYGHCYTIIGQSTEMDGC
ncbi:hypothetical protein ACOME3_007346 [Neoechinorhynchus agilis]